MWPSHGIYLDLGGQICYSNEEVQGTFFFFFFFFFKGFGESFGAFSLRYTIRVIISCLSTNETDVMAMLSLHRQSDFV